MQDVSTYANVCATSFTVNKPDLPSQNRTRSITSVSSPSVKRPATSPPPSPPKIMMPSSSRLQLQHKISHINHPLQATPLQVNIPFDPQMKPSITFHKTATSFLEPLLQVPTSSPELPLQGCKLATFPQPALQVPQQAISRSLPDHKPPLQVPKPSTSLQHTLQVLKPAISPQPALQMPKLALSRSPPSQVPKPASSPPKPPLESATSPPEHLLPLERFSPEPFKENEGPNVVKKGKCSMDVSLHCLTSFSDLNDSLKNVFPDEYNIFVKYININVENFIGAPEQAFSCTVFINIQTKDEAMEWLQRFFNKTKTTYCIARGSFLKYLDTEFYLKQSK